MIFRFLRLGAAIGITGFWSVVALTSSFLLSEARFRRVVCAIISIWARQVLRATGTRAVIVQPPPDVAPAIFVSNHLSHLDIPILLATLPHLKVIAKKELFAIPIFGPAMRKAGILEIDRQNHARAVATIEEAVEQVRAGTSLLVFAEGTRSRDGRVGPFKKGGFVLAAKTGAPIVPVAIRGTRELLPRGGVRRFRPGVAHVAFGTPIDTAGCTVEEKDRLMEQTREAVIDLFRRLPAPAAAPPTHGGETPTSGGSPRP